MTEAYTPPDYQYRWSAVLTYRGPHGLRDAQVFECEFDEFHELGAIMVSAPDRRALHSILIKYNFDYGGTLPRFTAMGTT